MAEADLPPPFGIPAGPSLPPEEVLSAFLAGEGSGRAPGGEFQIEGGVLMAAALVPLSVRIDPNAFLVRSDVPADVVPLRERLRERLSREGMSLIEEDPPLSQVVGIEATGQRGAVWDLWGRTPDEAHERLRARAAGEFGEVVGEPDREAARVDAVIAELERELEGGLGKDGSPGEDRGPGPGGGVGE